MKNANKIMETEYKFYTLVRKDHKFGDNDFMLGRLIGYQQLICDDFMKEDYKIPHGYGVVPEGTVILCKCTPDKYAEFTKLVKRHFPEDLCVFDWHKAD